MTEQELLKKLTKAKFTTLLKSNTAFINAIGLTLDMRIDPSIPSACTNGKSIKWNPEFLESLTDEEVIFVYIHECLHIAYMHTATLEQDLARGIDLKLLNIAQDYRINYDLDKLKLGNLPSKALFDPKYTPDWTSYQIYEDLLEKSDAEPDDTFFGGSDHVESGSDVSEQEIISLLAKAASAAIAAGQGSSIPEEVKVLVDKYLHPKIPTYKLIQQVMVRSLRRKIDPNKRNRRYPDLHIPAKQNKKEARIHIYLDVSGSVTDDEIATCLREVQLAARLENVSDITLVQFDTAITSVSKITNSEDVNNINIQGRGGTLIAPVLKHIKEECPTLAFIYTDGHFNQCTIAPKSKIVWCINNNPHFNTTYGTVIHYDASA